MALKEHICTDLPGSERFTGTYMIAKPFSTSLYIKSIHLTLQGIGPFAFMYLPN